MVSAVFDYFQELGEGVGRGWTRFWFTPRDPLGLALLRVLTGLLALYVVAGYTFDLVELFGPDGLLPVGAIARLQGDFFGFSYLRLAGTPGALWAMHIAGLVVLALFTVGALTPVTSVLAVVVALAYFHRAPLLTSQMEPVLAFLLVYLCLGPSGARLSVDRWLTKRRAAKDGAYALKLRQRGALSWGANVVTRLIQVHLAIVYVMMFLAQLDAEVWWNGTAMWWLLARPDSRVVDFTGLARHEFLLAAWTHLFVVYEGLFPVLAWNRLTAPLMVFVGFVFWGALGLASGLTAFSAAMVVAGLAFLPASTVRTLLGGCLPARALE